MEVLVCVVVIVLFVIIFIFLAYTDDRICILEKDIADLHRDSLLCKNNIAYMNKRIKPTEYSEEEIKAYKEKIRELDHYLYYSRVDYADLKKKYEELKMATNGDQKQNSPS